MGSELVQSTSSIVFSIFVTAILMFWFSDFDEDPTHGADHINFIIKRIKVHTDPHSPGYRFKDNYGVELFLEIFSEDDFDSFCLAYMFTYRDFEGGTLGLAWTGDMQNAGGVCEKNGVSLYIVYFELQHLKVYIN